MGGTILRSGAKKGSVGQATTLKGKRLRSTWGYQVRTILKMNKKIIIPSKGPSVQVIKVAAVIKKLVVKQASRYFNFKLYDEFSDYSTKIDHWGRDFFRLCLSLPIPWPALSGIFAAAGRSQTTTDY
jgi:hypothetical protein